MKRRNLALMITSVFLRSLVVFARLPQTNPSQQAQPQADHSTRTKKGSDECQINERLDRDASIDIAGGRGERLHPLTAFRPKPAIPFGGVFRIVDFTLSNCLNSRLDRVALLTQYRHEVLHDYIQRWTELWKTGGKDSHQLVCLSPAAGKRYGGTADAVFQNLAVIDSAKPEYVLILSGDHVYKMDYRELLSRHVATNADVTIAAVEHPIADATHFGCDSPKFIDCKGEQTKNHEKVSLRIRPAESRLCPRYLPVRLPLSTRQSDGAFR